MVSQTHLIRVRTAVIGRQLQNQAEKSHPITFGGNIKIRFRYETKTNSQAFMWFGVASGNCQPLIIRRVIRAPNVSNTRKESVASSHTSLLKTCNPPVDYRFFLAKFISASY